MAERRAKMVCTLGPASQDEGVIAALLDAGMDACRLNLSFGPPEDYESIIAKVRKVADAKGRSVAIIADLPGRKIRVGQLEGGKVDLLTGSVVTFQVDRGQTGHPTLLPVDPAFFHENLIRGDQILLSDGLVELEVTATRADEAEGRVLFGGVVAQSTGVHVPGMSVRGGLITDEDLPYLKMAAAQRVDYLALTYVTDGADILQARERLADMGANIPIIAKIERSEAFSRLDGILMRADAIMVRRGDLGAQIEVTRVPLVQKEILRLAGLRGVPVIIATQMLGSMLNAPTPTRAEASDVSNAVVDGADGLLLSAETAVGKFPVESAQMMDRIIEETEKERFEAAPKQWTEAFDAPFADTTARIACQAAQQTGARLIACFTESGRTARLVAKYRPDVPVVAFCRNEDTRRRLQVVWGVDTCQLTHAGNVEHMLHTVEELLMSRGQVRRGDRVVVVFGAPVGEKGKTNSVRLHEVGRLAATGDLEAPEGSE